MLLPIYSSFLSFASPSVVLSVTMILYPLMYNYIFLFFFFSSTHPMLSPRLGFIDPSPPWDLDPWIRVQAENRFPQTSPFSSWAAHNREPKPYQTSRETELRTSQKFPGTMFYLVIVIFLFLYPNVPLLITIKTKDTC